MEKIFNRLLIKISVIFLVLQSSFAPIAYRSTCIGNDARLWTNCQGVINFKNGDRYEGEFKDGKLTGSGTYYHLANNQSRGDVYTGGFLNGLRQGNGRYTFAGGPEMLEGIWIAGVFSPETPDCPTSSIVRQI